MIPQYLRCTFHVEYKGSNDVSKKSSHLVNFDIIDCEI